MGFNAKIFSRNYAETQLKSRLTHANPSCSGLGSAKGVRGAKNQSRVVHKQVSGSKRQAAEQTVGHPA